jgi:S1-C subfamily serine protease
VRPTTKIAVPVAVVGLSELELPAWTVQAQKPSAVLRRALTPVQLFGKVSASIYAVMVSGYFRGSAIAVTSHEAITSCHVVSDAESIVLVGHQTYRAEIVAADRATDRCYLRVQDGELKPVQGLRDYATPGVWRSGLHGWLAKGLVNTLGNGLVSGLRMSENVEYVQITAPISRGPVAAACSMIGNLIASRRSQSRTTELSFAIAASQFWQ